MADAFVRKGIKSTVKNKKPSAKIVRVKKERLDPGNAGRA